MTPIDPVDWGERQPRPPFVLTSDDGDLCLLALRQSTENEQNAALLDHLRVLQRRQREKEAKT